MSPAGRPAVFLDRDGTLIADRHYLGDPAGVCLLPGAAEALARLNRAGIPAILVTNQSGIGRGLYGEADFAAVQRRTEELLAGRGRRLDAVYHCPHSPEHDPPCSCRKPETGLFRTAAREHGIDLAASFFVGDRLRDVLPAIECGGRGILIGDSEPAPPPPGVQRAPSLAAAVSAILDAPQVDRS